MDGTSSTLHEVKISELPVATAANPTDQLEANQAGTSRSITIDQVSAVVAGSSAVTGSYLPLAGGTLTGPLGIGDHFTMSGSGNATARLAITGQFTDGAAPPLFDLIDLNMTGATPSTGFDIRFFGLDTAGAVKLGAVINGGMATRTAGSYKGDIDFLVYGPSGPTSYTVQAGIALSGIYSGLVPISSNAYQLGDSTLRWSTVNSVLGSFTGAVSTGALSATTGTFSAAVSATTGTFSGALKGLTTLSVGSSSTAEAIDLTGNLFLRTGGSLIYSGGAISLQAGAASALTFSSSAGGSSFFWSSGGLLQFGGTGAGAPALKRSGATTTLQVRTATDSADAPLTAASISTSATTFMHITTAALANGAAAGAGTLSNAPVAGNPTKWIPINDNGTTRYIPSW